LNKKVALITGVTGQDGALLSKFLIKKNYVVHGIKRRSSSFNTQRIDDIYKDPNFFKNNFFLHYGDLTDGLNIFNLINKIKPSEIYNLGAQSHVKVSFETPEYTANSDGLGVLRLLEAIKSCNLIKKTKFYQASTSEMFGSSPPIQNENTRFKPSSPYGSAKVFGYWITKNYRESYNMFASNGILFNHESHLRGETFVTKKITMAAANILKKKQSKLILGNLNAVRDWGDARDYVEGMWKILQYKKPEDFILATGKGYTVRKFVEIVFKKIGIILIWKGRKEKEKGIDSKTGKIIVEINPKYYRPNEVERLIGSNKKVKKLLNWYPKISLNEMIDNMLEHDIKNIK
tara:strand:- start:1602 stop:2639 length:1038 start_codon:yes stop_codon:yes gene_type:complete